MGLQPTKQGKNIMELYIGHDINKIIIALTHLREEISYGEETPEVLLKKIIHTYDIDFEQEKILLFHYHKGTTP
jgi:hypothetical protein